MPIGLQGSKQANTKGAFVFVCVFLFVFVCVCVCLCFCLCLCVCLCLCFCFYLCLCLCLCFYLCLCLCLCFYLCLCYGVVYALLFVCSMSYTARVHVCASIAIADHCAAAVRPLIPSTKCVRDGTATAVALPVRSVRSACAPSNLTR